MSPSNDSNLRYKFIHVHGYRHMYILFFCIYGRPPHDPHSLFWILSCHLSSHMFIRANYQISKSLGAL